MSDTVSLEEQFELYQTDATPELLKLLADEFGVSEDDLKTLGIGFCTHELAVIFADRDANGDIIGLIRWFRDDKKRSLAVEKINPSYILNNDVSKYIEARITGNLLNGSRASLIVKQWLEKQCAGKNNKPALWYGQDSFWEYRSNQWYRLEKSVLNNMLYAYLKDRNYIERRSVKGDVFITCRQYNPSKHKLRNILWVLKCEVIALHDFKMIEEHATVDAGKEIN